MLIVDDQWVASKWLNVYLWLLYLCPCGPRPFNHAKDSNMNGAEE